MRRVINLCSILIILLIFYSCPQSPGAGPGSGFGSSSRSSSSSSSGSGYNPAPTIITPWTPPVNSGWNYVGAPGFSPGRAKYTSAAFDVSGNLYAAFSDSSIGGKLLVMEYSSGSWSYAGGSTYSAGISAGQADWVSLAIDTNATPNILYVVYEDYANGGKATVMQCNISTPTIWSSIGTVSAGKAAYTCIKLDKNNTPYIVYSDGANGGKATVMKHSGGIWSAVGTGITPGAASYTTMAIDGSGNIFVAYCDLANNLIAAVVSYNGAVWSAETPVSYDNTQAQYPALALNAHDGLVYIALSELFLGGVTVQNYGLGSWSYISVSLPAYYTEADSISLDWDSYNNTYVGFIDEVNTGSSDGKTVNSVTVMKFSGGLGVWQAVGLPDFSWGGSAYASLAVYKNTPYVAFSDGGCGGRLSVMSH